MGGRGTEWILTLCKTLGIKKFKEGVVPRKTKMENTALAGAEPHTIVRMNLGDHDGDGGPARSQNRGAGTGIWRGRSVVGPVTA